MGNQITFCPLVAKLTCYDQNNEQDTGAFTVNNPFLLPSPTLVILEQHLLSETSRAHFPKHVKTSKDAPSPLNYSSLRALMERSQSRMADHGVI